MTSLEIHKIDVECDESTAFLEDPFDGGETDSTFPPMRYFPMHYPSVSNPPQKKVSMRRESSRERQRLYKELVGHEPYQPSNKVTEKNVFWVTLDIKHYKPEEVTLKVDGQDLVVSGKHYNETDNGFDSCEFQRKYTIPDTINMHTLTSNITPNGVLCIKATTDQPNVQADVSDVNLENFSVSLDVSGYRPDEIKISLHGHNLVIRGEAKSRDGAAGDSGGAPKTFARHFSLPSDVDMESIASRYTKDGKISVEAPRKVFKGVRTLELKEE